jgi:hypothetical protein
MFDFSISHKVLLFRNEEPERENINIDIIFEGVFYLDIPTRLEGLSILEADDQEISNILAKYNDKFYPEFGEKIFVIKSDSNKYFIGCVRYLIKENSLPGLTSSIK